MISKKNRIWMVFLILAFMLLIIRYSKPKTVTITIGTFSGSNWSNADDNTQEIINLAIKRFEAENPGVHIKYESGILKEDYIEWLTEEYLRGDEPDIYLLPDEDLAKFASRKALVELDSFMKNDFDFAENEYFDAALDTGKYHKVQYGLPFEAVPTVMCVNKTLLEKTNIQVPGNDWTWGDFHSICRRVTRDYNDDGANDQFGVTGYDWKYAAYSNGSTIFDTYGTSNYLGNSNVVQAINFVYRLDMLTAEQTVTENDFAEGNVAFMPMLLSDYKMYSSYPYSVEKYNDFEWECIPMPAGPKGDNTSNVSTTVGVISKNSTNQNLAWQFLKTLTYDEQVQTMVENESVYCSVKKAVAAQNKTDSLSEITMSKAIAVPYFDNYDEIMQLVETGVENVMDNENKIEVQMSALEKQLDKYME